MDLARYADTHGFEKDPRRSIWPYRDWVINALNRDLPFDQFHDRTIGRGFIAKRDARAVNRDGLSSQHDVHTEGGVDGEELSKPGGRGSRQHYRLRFGWQRDELLPMPYSQI